MKLAPRAEPYWRNIQEGRAIGYRRRSSGKAGSWIARHYDPDTGRRYSALGSADDLSDADGGSTLSFTQAQERARAWFREVERSNGRVIEPITVLEAMTAYVDSYKARGGKALRDLQSVIDTHVLPTFGTKQVATLTHASLRTWHAKLATAPARLRTKKTAEKPNVRAPAPATQDAQRARRSTANRILTVMKAALNLAYQDGRVPSDDAWRRVKPFPKVDAPRIRYVTDDEARRLVNACLADFRKLTMAALLTGCRYGELTALRGSDFDDQAAVLHIRIAKGGEARAVVLTDEAVRFFGQETAGKALDALIFVRDGGVAWKQSEQFRPLRSACQVAKVSPAVSFHILRHTFASRLAMRGVPMTVIAASIGNSEAICAKHYAHLAPSYIASTIREHAGGLNIVPESNVTPIRRAPSSLLGRSRPASVLA